MFPLAPTPTTKKIGLLGSVLANILKNLSDNDLYLALGLYALVYSNRNDLSEAEKTMCEQIFVNIKKYYKEFLILPALRELERYALDRPLESADYNFLAELILEQALSCCRDDETNPRRSVSLTRGNIDLMRAGYSRFFKYHQYDDYSKQYRAVLARLAATGATRPSPLSDVERCIVSFYETKGGVFITDGLLDHFANLNEIETRSVGVFIDTEYSAKFLSLEHYDKPPHSVHLRAIHYAWAAYLNKDAAKLDDAGVRSALKKLFKSKDKSAYTLYINLIRFVTSGLIYLISSIRQGQVDQNPPIFRLDNNVVRGLLPRFLLGVFPEEFKASEESHEEAMLRRGPAASSVQQKKAGDCFLILNLETTSLAMRRLYATEEQQNRFISSNPLCLLLQHTDDLKHFLTFHSLLPPFKLEERLAALFFLPICLLNHFNYLYDAHFHGRAKEVFGESYQFFKEWTNFKLDFFRNDCLQLILRQITPQMPHLSIVDKNLVALLVESLANEL